MRYGHKKEKEMKKITTYLAISLTMIFITACGGGGGGGATGGGGGTGGNNAPVAKNATVTLDEDTIKQATLNATDADGNTLTYTITSNPAHGTVTLSGKTATYTPSANYNGSDSFKYKANDNTEDSNIATVTITVNPVNDAPTANAQSLKVDEDINLSITLSGADADGDDIAYEIATNPTHGKVTFITANGADVIYEPNPHYNGSDSFTFHTYDTSSVDSANATINIDVEERAFIMLVEVNSTDKNFTIHTNGSDYNYSFKCSDADAWVSDNSADSDCNYSDAGEYNISIIGNFPSIVFTDLTTTPTPNDNEKLKSIVQWGTQEWTTFKGIFLKCYKMNISAIDKPNLTTTTSMESAFSGALLFDSDISNWNTSHITDMSYMFDNAATFNQDIGSWDTSSVTNMRGMFSEAKLFNQNLNNWKTASVTDMNGTFYHASDFNGSVQDWDTSSVTDMSYMFDNVRKFNRDVSDWNVSNVANMDHMFHADPTLPPPDGVSPVFNQDVSKWDTGKVTNMSSMFENQGSFTDHNLSDWNVSNVTIYNDFNSSWGGGNVAPSFP